MTRRIIVYGNSDKSKLGFPTPESLTNFLKRGIFADERGRYRYTQSKNAHLIVLSRDGWAYGHFDIASKQKPTADDRRSYPPVKCVYVVSKSTLYAKPVELSRLGVTNLRFGKSISESRFRAILARADSSREFAELRDAGEMLPGRYPEGAVKRIQVNAYERSPEAVSACKAHYGTRCSACGVDLGRRYGNIGRGFIHVHHLRGLATVGERYEVDPVVDLRPVCPNCHAMLHQKSPPLTIGELKRLIQRARMRRSTRGKHTSE